MKNKMEILAVVLANYLPKYKIQLNRCEGNNK